ncbi:MAG: T9SS type A sorting domain-containing protein [Flavobacteriales bacterium]|nr:T9SS type A sorting domain-containing protein [Flavobacteriales bacterium]
MKAPCTLLAVITTATVLAQPEITISNLPLPGDISTIGICSDAVDAAALNASAGAMQTWDFSGLTEESEEQFTFIAPDMTPWPTEFGSANLCGVSWDDAYSFYDVSGPALNTTGNAIIIPGAPPEDTAKVNLTPDPETIVQLPYGFGDGFSDTFGGTFSAMGFVGTVTGTSDVDVDGYGTLILPNATYTNVVRYHLDRVQNNTILGNTGTVTKEQWAWVSADHRFWILLMESIDDGFGTSSVVWYDKDPAPAAPTAVEAMGAERIGIYPNPIVAGASITVTGAQGLSAELRDATGRVVRPRAALQGPFATTGLVPGPYVLRLFGTTGSLLRTERVIIR